MKTTQVACYCGSRHPARSWGWVEGGLPRPDKVTESMVDGYWAMNRRRGSVEATIARLKLATFEVAAIAHLNELKMPILLLWGREGIVFPLNLAQTIVQAVPSARLVVYEDCGHFPQEERPDDTVRALRAFHE